MPIDYSKYPKNWHSEIRPRILKRADNLCEWCGLPNYAWVNSKTREICLPDEDHAIRIVLTVAHLDHDEENHDVKDDRLAALCQKCHLSYDIQEKQRRIREKRNQNQVDLFNGIDK